jgi:hypothetical protein
MKYAVLMTTGEVGYEAFVIEKGLRTLKEAEMVIRRDKYGARLFSDPPDFDYRWLIVPSINPNLYSSIPYGEVIAAY